MKENNGQEFVPNIYFNIEVAKRFWESSANECKSGQFNLELFERYLQAIHK
jgi:hypothetical protein